MPSAKHFFATTQATVSPAKLRLRTTVPEASEAISFWLKVARN